MATASTHRAVVSLGWEEVGRRLEAQLLALGASILHREEVRSLVGRRVAMVFGVSGPFAGLTFASAWFHGVRWVPYFLRIEELGADRTEVTVITGGSESLLRTDFGRNQRLADRILDGVADRARPV